MPFSFLLSKRPAWTSLRGANEWWPTSEHAYARGGAGERVATGEASSRGANERRPTSEHAGAGGGANERVATDGRASACCRRGELVRLMAGGACAWLLAERAAVGE